MKPNILLIDSLEEQTLSRLVAKKLAPNAFVYLAQPSCEEIEDTPEGVRLIPENPTLYKHFGRLDMVILPEDMKAEAAAIRAERPETAVVVLNRRSLKPTKPNLQQNLELALKAVAPIFAAV